MEYPSSTLLIVIGAVCAFLVLAKILKLEKAGAVFVLVVIILWLAFYLTGYDKTLYNILFNPPPIQQQSPFNR